MTEVCSNPTPDTPSTLPFDGGNFFRLARKTHGLTLREAAEHVGTNPRTLSALERNPMPSEAGPLYWDLVNFYATHKLSVEQSAATVGIVAAEVRS